MLTDSAAMIRIMPMYCPALESKLDFLSRFEWFMLHDVSHIVGHVSLRRRLQSYKLIPRPRYNCDRGHNPSKFGGLLLKDSFFAAAVESATDCDKLQE